MMKHSKKERKRRKNKKLKLLNKKNCHSLTKLVRTEYLKHLKKCLLDNLKIYYDNNGKKNIRKWNHHLKNIEDCAKKLEQKAIEACMLAPIYQQCMRRTIKRVLKKSSKCRLSRVFKTKFTHRNAQPNGTKDQAVQTCAQTKLEESVNLNVESPTITVVACEQYHNNNKKHTFRGLNDKLIKQLSRSVVSADVSKFIPIEYGEDDYDDNEYNHNGENILEEDEIAKELEELFSENKNEWDEFLGTEKVINDDPQIQSILMEIEQATLVENEHIYNNQLANVYNNNNNNIKAVKRKPLSQSLWPCELYMQRKRLNETIDRMVDNDMRCYDNIKSNFETLFGEDSDDEFSTFSPSIELDDILLGSCQERIKPWIIKHLMPAMQDGLIGNRYLFKQLAKELSRSIIQDNQYPDEFFIKRAVTLFFCLHSSVMSISDLMDISQISFNFL